MKDKNKKPYCDRPDTPILSSVGNGNAVGVSSTKSKKSIRNK